MTGASLALSALAQAHAEDVPLDELIERDPVVLALVPPRVGPAPRMDEFAGAPAVAALPAEAPDRAAVVREALRLRVRWVQELMARAAWELGRRLVDVGLLRRQEDVRHLHVEEVEAAVQRRLSFVHTDARAESPGRALPSRFRLDDDGRPWAAPARSGRRRARHGRTDGDRCRRWSATGPVHVHAKGVEVPAGSVLVVSHLDPRLAAVIPRLAGLVAETGSPLSHLAILAREHGVATVVGLADATTRLEGRRRRQRRRPRRTRRPAHEGLAA